MIIKNPTMAYLPSDDARVKSFLTYTDRSVQYQMHKLRQNFRWKQGDPDGFDSRMDELKGELKKTLVKYDDDGRPFTYSGLVGELGQQFGWKAINEVQYPEPKALPWNKPPIHQLRPYQIESVDRLMAIRHGAVELPTGAGKTACIVELVKRHGLKTLLVTPSKSITHQIYDEMAERFGVKYVGMYGGDKKQLGKLITVCTAQSLSNIEPGSKEYADLSEAAVLIFDESHTCPAETFERVCMGIARNAQYRYFFSATQMRGDGAEMLLKGITGGVVYRKTFRELVEEGYLARPVFRVFKVPFFGAANVSDPNKETRRQLFLNPYVLTSACEIARRAATVANRQVLILVDEMSQYELVKNYLKHAHTFVCGDTPQKEREKAIEGFNNGSIQILVGTSAISTGVDLKPVGCLIYLQGGMSEVQIKQALGRGTRLVPGKKDVWIVDFWVTGSRTMERHVQSRIGIYEELGDVQVIG